MVVASTSTSGTGHPPPRLRWVARASRPTAPPLRCDWCGLRRRRWPVVAAPVAAVLDALVLVAGIKQVAFDELAIAANAHAVAIINSRFQRRCCIVLGFAEQHARHRRIGRNLQRPSRRRIVWHCPRRLTPGVGRAAGAGFERRGGCPHNGCRSDSGICCGGVAAGACTATNKRQGTLSRP